MKQVNNHISAKEKSLDEKLISLVHTSNDPAVAIETAITIITAFLEQPQSSE